jgi:hypothetical protein
MLDVQTAIRGHLEFQKEGDAYLTVVQKGVQRSAVFNPEIRFNLLGMALEKHMMAILMNEGKLPENHTFRDLLNALKEVMPIADRTRYLLLRMDAHNSMCSLEAVTRTVPDEAEMAELIDIGVFFANEAQLRIQGA